METINNQQSKNEGKKTHTYNVSMYYHTSCTVEVKSETPLDEKEVIRRALALVDTDETRKELLDRLVSDDTPDVEEA